MKYVLLARPSSLIVNDMKKLISATGCEAKPLSGINELTNFNTEEVAGIVISTALTSTVKEKYWEVITRSVALFPGKPIFLASYATVKSTKITAGSHIDKTGLNFELLACEEARTQGFDCNKNILILTQKEISDDRTFSTILALVKGLLLESVNSQPL